MIEEAKKEYEESKKKIVDEFKSYLTSSKPKKEPIPKQYLILAGVAVLVVIVLLFSILMEKRERRKEVTKFDRDDYFMQSVKKDVERQKVYSIEDISRTVSGTKYKEEVMDKKEDKKEPVVVQKKNSKRIEKEKVGEKAAEKPPEARPFVVIVNQSEKDKEREKEGRKKVLGIKAGAKISAVIRNAVKGEMPVMLYTLEDYKVNDEVVIPADSELFGEARFNSKTERVEIRLRALILATGSSYNVKAMTLDEKGEQAGVYAQVNRKFEARSVGRGVASGIGKVAGLIPGVGGAGGVASSVLEGVTRETGDDAKDFERRQNVEFIINAGTKVKVVFEDGI